MRIRYLTDGMSTPSDDVEVIAAGGSGFYIESPEDPSLLLFVPNEFVFMEYRENAWDEPLNVHEMVQDPEFTRFRDVDYSLRDLFSTVH